MSLAQRSQSWSAALPAFMVALPGTDTRQPCGDEDKYKAEQICAETAADNYKEIYSIDGIAASQMLLPIRLCDFVLSKPVCRFQEIVQCINGSFWLI